MADDAILVVDLPQNVRLLGAVLTPYGWRADGSLRRGGPGRAWAARG